jgi:hypothetical protein
VSGNFFYVDRFSPLPGSKKKNSEKCLGRMFASNIKEAGLEWIRFYQRVLDDAKMQIIDAAEAGKRPPLIENDNIGDIYRLYYNGGDFKFVWTDFVNWLSTNGLTVSFTGNSRDGYGMRIGVSDYISVDKPEPLEDTSQCLNNLLKPKTTDFSFRGYGKIPPYYRDDIP